MAEQATNRVWASLTDSEAVAVIEAAESRGWRVAELVRTAVLAFINQPVAQPPGTDTAALAPVLARLDAIAGALGQHVAELGRLVPATDDALAERDEVRGTLVDIAQAVGVLAGSIEPDDDPGAEAAFGPDRD